MIEKHIKAGKLSIMLSHGEARLDELLAFASRENHKRGFLFVSKVLGKHIPVKPSAMRSIYNELADACISSLPISQTLSTASSSTTYVVGMAETATGLGAGVADSLARQCPAMSVIYQHTTRHVLPEHEAWFSLSESHSHAVDHICIARIARYTTRCKQRST